MGSGGGYTKLGKTLAAHAGILATCFHIHETDHADRQR